MKKLLKIIALAALLIAAGWIAAISGSPSFVERLQYSLTLESCLNRQGCWDYARDGCVFKEPAYAAALEPTPEQAASGLCYPNGDGDRFSEKAKHRQLW